jgi:hypothetical protein
MMLLFNARLQFFIASHKKIFILSVVEGSIAALGR